MDGAGVAEGELDLASDGDDEDDDEVVDLSGAELPLLPLRA